MTRIAVRAVPARAQLMLEQAGVHPLLARLYAARGVRAAGEVDYALEGIHNATIYDGGLLEPSMQFNGPAIIETSGSTVVVHPGNQVKVDDYGNLHIQLAKR